MENKSFSFRRFSWDDFVAAFTNFYRWWSDSDEDGSEAISVLERMGDTPVPAEKGQDLETELNAGRLVFVPFHEPITDDLVKCLDGSTLEDDADDPQIDIGVADSYGYLVELNDGTITFYPALYDGSSGPAPTVTLQNECGVFDKQMDQFLGRFS